MSNNKPVCPICEGEGWVCENHPDVPWGDECCGGAGNPCECNPQADFPPGYEILMDYRETLH